MLHYSYEFTFELKSSQSDTKSSNEQVQVNAVKAELPISEERWAQMARKTDKNDVMCVVNGVLLKGTKVIFPSYDERNSRTGADGLFGIEICKRCARELMDWQYMNRDIENLVQWHEISQSHRYQETKETLLPHTTGHGFMHVMSSLTTGSQMVKLKGEGKEWKECWKRLRKQDTSLLSHSEPQSSTATVLCGSTAELQMTRKMRTWRDILDKTEKELWQVFQTTATTNREWLWQSEKWDRVGPSG